MRIKLLLTLILPGVILLSSCSDILGSDNGNYGGELINKEKLSSIAASLFSENESEGDTNETREHDGVYYWTGEGAKYHKWRDCEHIASISNIYTGNITEAIRAGKTEPCSDCAKK